MSDNRANLLAVLKEQSDVVNLLIELGLAEVEAFKRDDIPSLISITERQKDAVDRTYHLEQLKAGLLGKLGLQMPVDNIGISSILESMDDVSSEIKEENKRLGVLARKLQEINETNRLLASMSLSYVRMIQRAMGMQAGGYDAKGMLSEPSGFLGRLDTSA